MQFPVNTYNIWEQLMVHVFYYSRLADEPTGTTEYLYSSCGPWVLLQIVSKQKFFIKQPLYHTSTCFLMLVSIKKLPITSCQRDLIKQI